MLANNYILWAGGMAFGGMIALGVALLLERLRSEYAAIPAIVSGAFFFLGFMALAVAMVTPLLTLHAGMR